MMPSSSYFQILDLRSSSTYRLELAEVRHSTALGKLVRFQFPDICGPTILVQVRLFTERSGNAVFVVMGAITFGGLMLLVW